MATSVKICGLSEESSLHAVIKAGADYAGFVHYPKSPRHVTIERAAELKSLLQATIKSVIVLVNPGDELLVEIARVMQPDYFQLHGEETHERVNEIRTQFPKTGIIKAIPVSNPEDAKKAQDFYDVADFILFDAKPESINMMHGGNGIAFDWNFLKGNTPSNSWFLSGGLNAGNIREAITQTGAKFVDVSSGVESSAGVKDAGLIAEFVQTARIVG